MSYENINIQESNFCAGPQSGTICTIDTTNPQTVLRIKNTSGGTIMDLTLSSNIITENIRLEYVGPKNLSTITDDLIFFTFEKVNDTTCLIKRWQTRVSDRQLLLKEQVIKSNSGYEYYNAIDFAVEYHSRRFTTPNEYYNYLDINNTTYIKTGTKMIIGPSNDADNEGAVEIATVSTVVGNRVYFTAPLQYQYIINDQITFYSHVYIYSSDGYAGDNTKGTLYKIDAYSWMTKEIDTKAFYKKVTASRWCPMIEAVASIVGTNMLFVRPYDSYLNWRSMFLNNVSSDKNTIFTVYDVLFDNYSILKLQKNLSLRDDSGVVTTYAWENYNFQEDTLLPYTNSIVTNIDQSILTGYNKNIDIYTKVRDQYHVGLRDVYIQFYKSGDEGSLFDPLDGSLISDINGEATINYRSGTTYYGHSEITTRAAGSSSSTGSEYVWTSNNIISYPYFLPVEKSLFQLKDISNIGFLYYLRQEYKISNPRGDADDFVYPSTYLYCKSFFTSPGGDWGSGENYVGIGAVQEYLPMLYRPGQTDSPWGATGYGFEVWPWEDYQHIIENNDPFFIGNNIKLINDVSGESVVRGLKEFKINDSEVMVDPYVIITQPDESGSLQLSQLKLSLHTYWLDGQPYDYLWLYTNIDQFVFVEDAIPQFWSEKNSTSTNIWLRLRPFAFSLNNSSLRMWVREESYMGDTGYVDVTNSLTINNFDAGSGLLGIEVTYNPLRDFYYGAIVYVRIEVYDEAPSPNFIWVEYWFKIIPDYRAPYLTNLSPDRGEINVPVDNTVYFEIEDSGTGIDIDTLECFINSRRIQDTDLIIEKVSIYHYKITYTPSENFYFGKQYNMTVKVVDSSPNINVLHDSYKFYTAVSDDLWFEAPYPRVCKRGMDRFEDVGLLVLATGEGVDEESIRMQVYNKDVTPRKLPIIYRIS